MRKSPALLDAAPESRPRVVLIDSRPDRMGVMRALLEGTGLAAVVGEANTKAAAVEEVGKSLPDVAFVEIQIPVAEGLQTVAELHDAFPQVRIVVCSFHQDAETLARARENGADAYLDKPVDFTGLRKLLAKFSADLKAAQEHDAALRGEGDPSPGTRTVDA
ncbi:MAG: response regulator [Actinomycetota bacterium]